MLEILSQYNFSIRHLKGKEMYISDFLSRHPGNDNLSPNKIIPIAFILDNWLEFHEEMEEIPEEYILQCWSDYDDEESDSSDSDSELLKVSEDFECSRELESEDILLYHLLEECNITTRKMRQKAGETVQDI